MVDALESLADLMDAAGVRWAVVWDVTERLERLKRNPRRGRSS